MRTRTLDLTGAYFYSNGMVEEDSKKSFRVVDSRRFESDGAPRAEEKSKEEKDVTAASGDKGASKAQSSPPTDGSEANDQMTFSAFIVSLGTQALMQLGEIPPPDGMKLEKDVKAAKNYIDIVEILKIKSQGNLDAAEAQLLEQVLYSLRMAFVRATSAR